MNRTVVVTGGTSGIGLAIAHRFANDGDKVTVVSRSADRVREVAERLGVQGEVCDVSSATSVRELAERLPTSIDVVIAMAGRNADFEQKDATITDEIADLAGTWTENLRINTIGTVLAVTALIPKLHIGSSIITVSSIGAEYASSSYGAAKAAVAAWTAGLSAQLGPRGITANTIAPGYIEGTEFFAGSMSRERHDALVAATHTKRAGRPDDVAGLAAFLASEDARQITGQTIHVNGGAYTTR